MGRENKVRYEDGIHRGMVRRVNIKGLQQEC